MQFKNILGGGHSDIFGAPEEKLTHARPKYDQQNSSNISGALGTTDANDIAEQTARELKAKHGNLAREPEGAAATNGAAAGESRSSQQQSQPQQQQQTGRGRVPPGGFSQGFW